MLDSDNDFEGRTEGENEMEGLDAGFAEGRTELMHSLKRDEGDWDVKGIADGELDGFFGLCLRK